MNVRSRLIVAVSTAAAAYAIASGTAMAGIMVPDAKSTFQTSSDCGSLDISTAGLGTQPVSCSGANEFGSFSGHGTAKTFHDSSGALTASVDLTASISGEASVSAEAEAHFIYYVGLDTVAPPPVLPSAIPVDFTASAKASGAALGGLVGVSINALISGYSNVSNRVEAAIGDTAETLDDSDPHSGMLLFDPSEGDAIARINLDVACSVDGGSGPDFAPTGFTSGHVSCTADPLVGFDQDAFDALMGPNNTFQLADYFTFVFSEGLEAPSAAVPEPGALALLGPGLILLGLVKRRRRRR